MPPEIRRKWTIAVRKPCELWLEVPKASPDCVEKADQQGLAGGLVDIHGGYGELVGEDPSRPSRTRGAIESGDGAANRRPDPR